MASSSRAGDTAPPDGSDPAPAGTEAERRPETERATARTSEGAASSAQQRPASSGAVSARASGDTITLTTWVGTWNVGNVAPKMDAVTQWLARARGHDLVAVAAQEASYPHSRANLKPEAVWAETLAARRGGDAEAENACDATRLVAEAGSTASDSDSEEAQTSAAGRAALDEDGTDAHSVDADKCASAGCDSSVFAKKKRGFFGSSKFARASGALAGALAGGVVAGPLAPFGLVAGAAAGYYSSARVAAELKSRRHWFELCAAAMGPEYCMVQTATLLQMRLVVFARVKTVMEKRVIRSTRVGYQATGLLGAVGNKGGLMVRLGFSHGGAVAFVACHLAAHEGEKHVTARDESVAAILRGCWDGSVEKAVGETDVGSAQELARDRDRNDADSGKTSTGEFSQKSSGPSVQKRPTRSDAHENVASNTTETRELLACTDHVFVFGDLNYRVDPGAVEHDSSSSAEKRLKKLGWGARWKKTNDAPSGSLVAAVAGLAKKTEKRKNADAAFRRNAAKEVAAPKSAEGVETAMNPADESESEELKNDADDVSGSAAAMTRWVEGWLAVADLAALGRFDALAEGDQLRREMSRGRALRGFVEAPITFAPTFKLETSSSPDRGAEEDPGRRGDVDVGFPRSLLLREYARKRIPSWCDRVLVRSLSPARACRFLTYASCPGVRSSDHAPVYASCELDFSSRGGGTFLLSSSPLTRDDDSESVFTQNAAETSESSPTRRVALRVRVSSFRVALEDDEDEDGRTVSVEKTNDDDDDDDDASSDDGRYDVPGTPLYRAGSRTGRETMMEKLVARAASLKTSSETSVCGNAETTSADLPRLSRNRKRSPRSPGARDASSGARAAMEKLQRGATATARFSFPFSEKEKQTTVETFAAAGVTCRPKQPFVRDVNDDATSFSGETNLDSNERDFRDGIGTDSRFTPATVTAHWAAASLPVVELGVCDVTNLRDVVRELGGRVAVASVAIDKEHAGSAIIDLGEVCFAFRGAHENAESVFVESQSPQTVSAAFDVPFDRFARRRGRAEGTLTLEVVPVGEEE